MQTLKEIRESKGIKQGAVADHLGVIRQTYASYEQEQEKMSVAQAKAVCAFIGCSIDEFFCPRRSINQTFEEARMTQQQLDERAQEAWGAFLATDWRTADARLNDWLDAYREARGEAREGA